MFASQNTSCVHFVHHVHGRTRNRHQTLYGILKMVAEGSSESESPVLLTQQISDEENNTNGVESIQYRGQPAWQLTIGNTKIIHKMDDLTFNWEGLKMLLQEKGVVLNEEGVNSLPAPDENGDIWLSKEKTVELLEKYKLKYVIEPLHTIESPEKKRQATADGDVMESPLKKSKVKIETGDVGTTVRTIYEKEVPPDGIHTLRPVWNDSVVNENSKVILSSLFLPYQDTVTLADVFKNAFSAKKEEKSGTGDNNGKAEGETEGEREGTSASASAIVDESQIVIDVPIDDNGQCALHLAATLGRIPLVKELIERGTNRFRGDNDGQTALMRSVHATNVFEVGLFDQLLDLLYPTIKCQDSRDRTVLHHIALTCGLKGRYDASVYYLETLLEWIVKKGGQFGLPLSDFIKDVLNIQDKYGNTCLNYASLAGNKYIVSQLLDLGADPYKANKVGVTPGDWGIKVDKKREDGNGGGSGGSNGNTESDGVGDAGGEIVSTQTDSGCEQSSKMSNSLELLDSIQTYLTSLGKDFKSELVEKSAQIDKLNPILREKTFQLSQKRKQYDELQKMIKKMSKITGQVDNLNKAIEEEEQKFQNEVKHLNIEVNEENYLGRIDADQPFTIPHLYEDVSEIVERVLEEKLNRIKSLSADDTLDAEAVHGFDVLRELETIDPNEVLAAYRERVPAEKREQICKDVPPSVVLDARIAAYAKNNELLMEKMRVKTTSNKELESQFKRIIGLCIGTNPENIDDNLLSNLLMSVETDPDPEINQIKKVLKIVGDK